MAEHISDDDLERYAMGTVSDGRELAAPAAGGPKLPKLTARRCGRP